MVRSVSIPSSPAIFRSCSHARMDRPSGVFVTSQVKMASTVSVVMTMAICIQESCTAKPSCSISFTPPGSSAGIGLTRAPWLTWTKFCSTIDMPMALISGARRNDPRSGR